MKIRLLLLASLLGCCGGMLADSPETVIRVVVTNQFDKPVPNADEDAAQITGGEHARR